MAPAINAVGLCKTFQVPVKEPGLRGSLKAVFGSSRRAVDAVRDLSFTASQGEMLACIGPNGAGKSTTIKMLTGILFQTYNDGRNAGNSKRPSNSIIRRGSRERIEHLSVNRGDLYGTRRTARSGRSAGNGHESPYGGKGCSREWKSVPSPSTF